MDEKVVSLRWSASAYVDALVYLAYISQMPDLFLFPFTFIPHNQHLDTSHRIIKTKTRLRDFERLNWSSPHGKGSLSEIV